MITVTLTAADLLRLRMIALDRDAEDALAFIRERLLPAVEAQQQQKMTSHLDGGKGSMF
ncbi:MAG TPA: hypothetical protein VGM23_01000 [Armatimonadota bacterium]|jgi:hypothetical protein